MGSEQHCSSPGRQTETLKKGAKLRVEKVGKVANRRKECQDEKRHSAKKNWL